MEEKEKKEKLKKRLNTYLRFSNIGIQMGIIITAGALGGKWLDDKQNNEFPIWTLSLTLFSIFVALYQVIRAVIKMSKENEEDEKGEK